MRASFIVSAADVGDLPDRGIKEVALLGRSNVGKSSLLNRLAAAKIARTSKTPGRTQLINLFEVETVRGAFGLVDLPGYGFAEAPEPVRLGWRAMVERYLVARSALAAVLVLVDLRRGAQEEDHQMWAAIERAGRQAKLVATKIDQLGKAQRGAALAALERSFSGGALATSAQSQEGIPELRRWIERACASTSVRSR
jgi:GTP-binding protein